MINNKPVSKHANMEAASKKKSSIVKQLTAGRFQSIKTVTSKSKVEIIEVEKGSDLFKQYINHLDFLKEYKEKYNMAYKAKDLKGYNEFLDKLNEYRCSAI
jgi:hypothetical protein